MAGLSRRSFLAAGVGAGTALGAGAALGVLGAGAGPLATGRAYAAPAQPPVRSRSDWAARLPSDPSLPVEADGDVQFLIVHHSESPNHEQPGSIPARLRGFHAYHTITKQWPDVAYNFFVDPFGTIWEGRAGSLARPVRGDATGGSQGFAQLCCFVGDHTRTPPTPAAMAAMTSLLAWLSGRYGIDLFAGKAIRFTSRGSNRWPRGTEVVTDPIVGHRDMSQTACPGDALYRLVRSELLVGAQRLVGSGQAESPGHSGAPTPPVDEGSDHAGPPRQDPASRPADSSPARANPTHPGAAEEGPVDRVADVAVPLGAATVVAGAAVAAGGIILSRRRD